MKKYITIEKDSSIKVSSQVTEVMSPSFIYLPIQKSSNLYLSKRKVYKGDLLYENEGTSYFSPISGRVEKIIERENGFGEKETFLQIKNDYQENDYYHGVENTTMMLTNDIKKKIKEYFSQKEKNLKKNTIILLNGLEDEPYVANTSFLLKLHGREILLMLDALSSIYKISSIQVVIKETDRDSIEALEEILNIYPNIQMTLLKDYYLLGKPDFLKEYLNQSQNTTIFSLEEVLDSYYEIFKLRKRDFLYVTVTGNGVFNPQVFEVKIGTSFKDLLEYLKMEKNVVFLANGLLMGNQIDENLILTESIRVIYIMKKSFMISNPCISCGKCNEVCPVFCNPYKSIQTKEQNEKCISCGLCTYICPSNILIETCLKGKEKKKYIGYPYPKKNFPFFCFLILFALMIYGIYKNGVSYYFLNEFSLKETLSLLLYPSIGILESIFYSILKKEKINWNTFSLGLILGILVPPSFPLWLFLILSSLFFFLNFVLKKWLPKFSTMNFYKILLIISTMVFSIPLSNIVEQKNTYLYGTIDIFFGRGLGGFGSTSIFLLILFYFYLSTNTYYKKEIPIYIILSYTCFFFIFFLLMPTQFLLKDYLNPSIFFVSILFASQNEVSPISKKVQLFTSIGIGLLSFLFIHLLKIMEGAFIAFFIINLFFAISSRFYYRQKSTK